MKISLPVNFSAILLLLTTLSTSTAHAAETPQEADRVIAIVNNEAITRYELNERVSLIKRQLVAQRTAIPNSRELEKQVLDRIIDIRLQLQLAKNSGITVDDADLATAIARIAENNQMDTAKFKAKLAQENINWDKFRNELREEIITARLRDQEVSGRIEVSDAELNNYLSKQGMTDADNRVVTQTHARHILLKVDKLISDEEARRKLVSLRTRLQNGDDFAALAKLYSNDFSAVKGGDLGWLYPGDTVPAFETAMNALKPQEISAPVRSPFGWHLIQVLERRTDTASPERRRQLARAALRERKAEEAQENWLRALRDRSYIEYRLDY